MKKTKELYFRENDSVAETENKGSCKEFGGEDLSKYKILTNNLYF